MPACGAVGELHRVLTLVLRCASSETQRLVRPVGHGVVADIKVGSELRGRDEEPTTRHDAVPYNNWQEYERQAKEKGARSCDALPARNPIADEDPDENDGNEDEGILAGEAQRSHAETEPQAAPTLSPLPHDEPAQNPDSQADEEHVEHGLLKQGVEEYRGGVQCQQQP